MNMPDAMIDIKMDGREIQLLKNLLSKAVADDPNSFKGKEHQLLFDKLEERRKLHHERHYVYLLSRYDKRSS